MSIYTWVTNKNSAVLEILTYMNLAFIFWLKTLCENLKTFWSRETRKLEYRNQKSAINFVNLPKI